VFYDQCRTLGSGYAADDLLFSLVGIAGSYGVAWFGIRVNTFANSRTAFASLEGKPFRSPQSPEAGMSIGMLLISVELLIMLVILLFVPGVCGRASSVRDRRVAGAAALRIAGASSPRLPTSARLDEDRLQDQRGRRAIRA